MNHDFGSIAEPGTRSCWEDWDDIDEQTTTPGLEWEMKTPIPEEINTLCIFEGGFLSDSIEKSTLQHLELVNSIPKARLHLFKSNSANTFLCTVKGYDLVQSTEIVQLLRPYLEVCKYVVVSLMLPLQQFQCVGPLRHSCVARRVSTSRCSQATAPLRIQQHLWSVDKLEQPNIITGVTAGVLSLCEHLDVWATALVCYTTPSTGRMPELEALMSQLNLPAGDHGHATMDAVFSSNLYI